MRIRGELFEAEIGGGMVHLARGHMNPRETHAGLLIAEAMHYEATSKGHAHLVISDDLATLCGAEIAGVVAGSGAPRCRRCEVMAHALGEGSAN